MLEYKFHNVNPKGRRTGDCSTRALVGVLGINYSEALKLQCEVAAQSCYGVTDKQVMEKVLKKFHWKKMKQPRKPDGKKYKVKELDEIISEKQLNKGVFVSIAGHHTCVKGYNILDTWNCGEYTVRNYYVKEF